MFTSIVIVIVVIYVFGYAGMIIYDLFLKKEPVEFMPKPKDVEIAKQPSVTAQSTSSHTPEEIVTAHPIADGESSGKDNGEQSAPPPPPSATPFGSDDAKSEGKTSEDFGPRPTDAETQKRINELVKLRRGEMLTDEMTASMDDSPSAPENTKVKDPESSAQNVRIIGPEHTVSPDVSDAVGKESSKEKTPSGANFKEATPPTPVRSNRSSTATRTLTS